MEVPIEDFPLDAYSQQIPDHLNPKDADYTTPLLNSDYQQNQLRRFYNHYFSTDAQGLSPWSEAYIQAALPIIKQAEMNTLNQFSNEDKSPAQQHYGENFKPHDLSWWLRIKNNMDLEAISNSQFNPEKRAIAVQNTLGRALPEMAPDFYHASLPGEGFPFDNLQDSAIWAGTPLYVVSISQDKAWSLVVTPDSYFSWVKSQDIAYASDHFIQQWQNQAQESLLAITKTQAAIIDQANHFQFSGYMGAVFPLVSSENEHHLFIPIKNKRGYAAIKIGVLAHRAGQKMPLIATKQQFALLIAELKNRPYGWGGSYFYNDCSQELKSLMTPFGIWLPRNSGAQSNLSPALNLADKNLDERLALLKEKGHPLFTLLYIGGHIMLYMGQETVNQQTAAMTYQNIWGLAPKNRDKRYIIGQSVFLPLLKSYPESADISSLADKKEFKMVYLDQLSLAKQTPQALAQLLAHPRKK